tara:strand:- start:1434 stop:2459 length:1026 start_codon:yes stop_codon:yes gene_type:complete
MYIIQKLFKQTLSIKQKERKRILDDISETQTFINKQYVMNRHDFIRVSKNTIYKNFPGISLENERHVKGRIDCVTIKAKNDTIGRSCPISVRQHSKNSIYFVLNFSSQCVTVKCFKCDGYKILDEDTNVLKNIQKDIVISDKSTKKSKTSHVTTLENLDHIQIVQFKHNIMHVDNTSILEFYDANKFVLVAARRDKKCPVFQNWTNRTYEMNEKINMNFNNIAIVCGRESNIFVIDIDVHDGNDSLKYFQQLCTLHNYRYDNMTTCILTPSGGIHLYFIWNEKFSDNSVQVCTEMGKLSIDIRSNNGIVIAPPSKYVNGEYKFLCMKKPQLCPEFLFKLRS